jgi:uncharacterized protein DUF6438
MTRTRGSIVVLIVALGLAGSPSRAAEVTPQTLAEIPTTDITAIELRRLSCFGKCPVFSLRLTADGRARFIGHDQRGHDGVLDAQVDFRTLAAWVVSQHLETLAEGYGQGTFDLPGIDLVIERWSGLTRYHSNVDTLIPLRLEGVVLALEGELERARWRKEDALTPFFGEFTNGEREVDIDEFPGTGQDAPQARGTAVLCTWNALEQSRGAIRVRCEKKGESTLVSTVDGFVAQGDAIVPGRYRRFQSPPQQRPLGEVPAR